MFVRGGALGAGARGRGAGVSGRFLRSAALRRRLFDDYDGKCAVCGVLLGDDWHADHIVPWCKTGRTNVYEMQPTCPSCNLKKAAKVSGMIDYSKARPRFQDIVEGTIKKFVDGATTVSIVAPPRWGKSSIVRVLMHEAFERGVAKSGLVLAPGTLIPKSISNRKKCVADVKRYRLSNTRSAEPEFIKGPPITKKALDGLYRPMLACSYQLMQYHGGAFIEWVESQAHKHGVGPLVCCDEAHYLSETQAWGTTVRALVDAGARLVLLTATPIRHDGERLPGVEYEAADESTYYRQLRNYRFNEDGERIADVYEGVKSAREVKADFTVTFGEAWEEKPQCIAFISPVPVDFEVTRIVQGEGDRTLISELSPSKAREALSSIMRDRGVIGQMVDRFLKIHLPKANEKGLQGMIRCAARAQTETADQEQINIILDEINRRTSGTQRVIVATMDSEDDAHKAIESFAERGQGDILLVKGMGGVGLDFPNVKTVMDLSTQRSVASTVQFMLRAGMPGSSKVFDYIFPNDTLARRIVDMVTDGGRLTEKELSVEHEEKTGIAELEEGETKDRADYVAGEARFGSSNDHDDNIATGADMELAIALADSLPMLRDELTLQALAARIRSNPTLRQVAEARAAEVTDGPVGRAKAIESMSPALMRAELHSKVRKIATLRGFRYVPERADPAKFKAFTHQIASIYDQVFAMGRVERPQRSRGRKLMDLVTDDEASMLYGAALELLARAEAESMDRAG